MGKKKATQRGGFRPGSGRKKTLPDGSEAVTVVFPPDLIGAIREVAQASEKTVSDVVRDWLSDRAKQPRKRKGEP